jgi:hypothetical protein
MWVDDVSSMNITVACNIALATNGWAYAVGFLVVDAVFCHMFLCNGFLGFGF